MMKRKLPLLLLSLAVLITPVAVQITGCRTANTVAFKAASTSRVSVEVAMGLWNEYVKQGKATLDQERKVKALFEKYQAAAIAAAQAGKVWSAANQTNSAGATGFQAAFTQAAGDLAQISADLLTLLQTYGVKV